jgi:radical SAM superfamily enzyme YgiQ (UPF0313 family)
MSRVALYSCGGEKPVSEIPLGIGYLIAFSGHRHCGPANSYDVCFKQNTQELVTGCDSWDIVGFSSPAFGLREAVSLARQVKARNRRIVTVLGGQGALWEGIKDYLEHPFDYIVRGDGEFSFNAILSNSLGGGGIIPPIRTPDLDLLPFPERGKVEYACPIVTSRGCPHNCAFCSSRAQWGKQRFHSAEYVMEPDT